MLYSGFLPFNSRTYVHTTLHLVILFPLGHPGCSSLSFFPHFLMILKVLELLVRYFIESPSADNSLMIFS